MKESPILDSGFSILDEHQASSIEHPLISFSV